MTTAQLAPTQLVADYFELWKTTDDATRAELAAKLFAPDAVQLVVPGDVTISGADNIEANIKKVNEENIQQAGLAFREGQCTPNHDAFQMNWEVVAPNGQAVGSGRDFLLLDDEGRIRALYMFMAR